MRKLIDLKLILMIFLLTFQSLNGFSEDNESTQTKPANISKYENLGEIVLKNLSETPEMVWRSYNQVSPALIIGDKVYCSEAMRNQYWKFDEEYEPENWKLWMYDIAKNKWTVECDSRIINRRDFMSLFNCNGNVLVYGGWVNVYEYGNKLQVYKCFNDGCLFDTKTKEIRKLPEEGAPCPRAHYSSVFNGEELIIFGGTTKDLEILNDGAIFNVKTWKWRKISSEGAFSSLALHNAVWLPKNPNWKHSNCMLVWGGTDQIEAIYKKSMPHNDETGKHIDNEPVFDHYKIIPKTFVAVYYPETNKWEILKKLYYDDFDKSYYENRYARNWAEIALAGDFIIEWGGVDEDEDWVFRGRKFDLRTLEFCEMSKLNQPPARTEHKLIPFQEADETGKICNKVLVAFGDLYVIGGCATGWHSSSCGVYNVERDRWEKKMFCLLGGFMSARRIYFAWDADRVFYHNGSTVIYDIKTDIADKFVSDQSDSNSPFFRYNLTYFDKYYDRHEATTTYYYLGRYHAGMYNNLSRLKIFAMKIPDDFDKKMDKPKFETVGIKQSIFGSSWSESIKIYNSENYTVVFDIENIYFTDDFEYPRCNACGFFLNKKTGEIFDIPVYENSLAREYPSVVLSDDKLFIIGGKHVSPFYYNEYSWENSEARTDEMPVQRYKDLSRTKCKMPLETRKRLYSDYPYLDDMYIFDLDEMTWTQKFFPKEFKSRRNAVVRADDSVIYVIGGQRDRDHDNIPQIPKEKPDWNANDYELKNGFCYDIKWDEYFSFDIDSILVEKYMEPGLDYKIHNNELYLVNYDFNFDENTKPIMQKLDFTTRKWQKFYFPQDKIVEDMDLLNVISTKNDLCFMFSYDGKDEETYYTIYLIDADGEFIEIEGFRSEFEKLFNGTREITDLYETPQMFIRDNKILCNIHFKHDISDEDADEGIWVQASKGFIFDLNTQKIEYISDFPDVEEEDDIASVWFEPNPLLPDFSLIITHFSPEDDDDKYGDDVSEVFKIYRLVK